MIASLRLVISDKRGIQKRVDTAIKGHGARVVHVYVRREMRGMKEVEIPIIFQNEDLLPAVLAELGKISGVTVLSSVGSGQPAPHSP